MEEGTLFDDAHGPARREPTRIEPELAKRYRDAARQVALEGEDAIARRLKPGPDDMRLKECREFLQTLAAARGDGAPFLFSAVMREAVAVVHARRGRCRFDDPMWQHATSKGSFARDAKQVIEPPPCMADPHVVLDMGELRRYVRFRDRLFDLYEELGDELFPPKKEPVAQPRDASRQVVRVFNPNTETTANAQDSTGDGAGRD